MAVTMVIGNRPEILTPLFQQGYSMAAVIANEFAEAADLQLSSLILVGLLLFLVTFVLNLASMWMLAKMVKSASGGM
jgi:phosphate transport system permease protein